MWLYFEEKWQSWYRSIFSQSIPSFMIFWIEKLTLVNSSQSSVTIINKLNCCTQLSYRSFWIRPKFCMPRKNDIENKKYKENLILCLYFIDISNLITDHVLIKYNWVNTQISTNSGLVSRRIHKCKARGAAMFYFWTSPLAEVPFWTIKKPFSAVEKMLPKLTKIMKDNLRGSIMNYFL